jgi:hypothetical protein
MGLSMAGQVFRPTAIAVEYAVDVDLHPKLIHLA